MLSFTHHCALSLTSHHNVWLYMWTEEAESAVLVDLRAVVQVFWLISRKWWTSVVDRNESSRNTTTTTISCDSFCFSVGLSHSLTSFSLSPSCFCSLSHTHNYAVEMNAPIHVTDCETVTHTQQRLRGKDTFSPLFSPPKVWCSPELFFKCSERECLNIMSDVKKNSWLIN